MKVTNIIQLIVLLCVVGSIHCQLPPGTCQAFNRTLAPLSQCGTVVNYRVFVPANSSLTILDQLVASRTGAFRLGLSSLECTENAMQFLCAEAFRRCTSIPGPNGTVIAIPSQTCRRRCEKFVSTCAEELEKFGSVVPDCNFVNETTGRPNFPVKQTIIPLPTANLSIPCNNPDVIGQWTSIPYATCYGKLKTNDTPLSKCNTVIDYDVYIPDGETIESLDLRASATNALARTNSVPYGCANATMRFVCASAFRRCEFLNVSATLPLALVPSQVCYENCWSFRDQCNDVLENLYLKGLIPTFTPQNCEIVNQQNAFKQPNFPVANSTYFFPASNLSLYVPCAYPEIITDYRSPRCEKFAGYPEECKSVVDWPVFIPPGSSQEKLAATAAVNIVRSRIAVKSCRQGAIRQACASAFLKCTDVQLSPAVKINLPSFVCRSLCEEVKGICEGASERANVDCDILTPAGAPAFPEEGSTTVLADGTVIFTPCHVPLMIGEYPRPDCPEPFFQTDDDELQCGYGCPSRIFTDAEWTAHFAISTIFAYLGLIFGIFTFISLSAHPLKRTFPKNIINFQILAATLMAVAYFINHLVWDGYPYKGTWCIDSTTIATGQTNPACAAQSFFLYNFEFALVWWYVMVAIFMVRAIFNIQIPIRMYKPLHLALHLICWGIPISIWIGLMASDNINSQGTFPCFVDTAKWEKQMVEVFFWYPVTILLFIGLGLTAFSAAVIIKKLGKVGFRRQIRVLLYLMYNFAANIWIVFYHYYLDGRQDAFIENSQNWAFCTATSIHPCELRGGLEYTLYLIQVIVFSSQPFILSIILLSDSEIWYWYRDLIRKYILREEIDDRLEAIQRVKAVQESLNQNKNTVSSTASNTLGDWAAD